MKRLVLEMKEKSSVYIAVPEDPIDKKLAEFINACNDPHKLSQLFIRECEGVYQFGSKRVYVKFEQDKVLIRVGGGFLSLEEFLSTHVPLELEKLARNDPIKILSKNIAVQKTIAGRAINENEKNKSQAYSYKNYSPLLHKTDIEVLKKQ